MNQFPAIIFGDGDGNSAGAGDGCTPELHFCKDVVPMQGGEETEHCWHAAGCEYGDESKLAVKRRPLNSGGGNGLKRHVILLRLHL